MFEFIKNIFREGDPNTDEMWDNGDIEEVKYTYKYNKPKILYTISGDYKKWEKARLKEAGLITILGKRRVGKTALCLNLSENLSVKSKKHIQTIGMGEAELPEFITDIEDVTEVYNKSILAVGEGAIVGNSRSSMTKSNVNLARLLPIISHKDVTIVWCSQSGFKTDKNTIFEADTLILMKPSLMQLWAERKAVQELYKKYMPMLNEWIEKIGSSKGVAVLYSEEFVGIVRGKLPSFWSEEISKSYADQEVMR